MLAWYEVLRRNNLPRVQIQRSLRAQRYCQALLHHENADALGELHTRATVNYPKVQGPLGRKYLFVIERTQGKSLSLEDTLLLKRLM